MKRSLCPALALVFAGSLSIAAQGFGGVVGTQCWIKGKLVGGFPPGYTCPETGGGGGPAYSPPAYDYEAERQRQEAERLRRLEAERQRQQELEEQRRQGEEEARKRREKFDRDKQEALDSMKGITEGELGIKGVDFGGSGLKDFGEPVNGGTGLKDIPTSPSVTQKKKPDCEWGNMGSSVVDLRCLGLDPNRSIFVDPRVVKGLTRGYPAQIDPATFRNVNYNKGFEALMRLDVASAAAAVKHFEKAQSERPDDPLVHNGLLLARDILKARQAKDREQKAQAQRWVKEGAAALMCEETGNARAYIAHARELDPDNRDIEMFRRFADVIAEKTGPRSPPGTRSAYKMFVHAVFSMEAGNDSRALHFMEAAHKIAPGDPDIAEYLRQAREFREDRAGGLEPMDPKEIMKRKKP